MECGYAGHYNYSLHAFQHSSKLLKSQFAQIIGKLTIIVNNVDSKSKWVADEKHEITKQWPWPLCC